MFPRSCEYSISHDEMREITVMSNYSLARFLMPLSDIVRASLVIQFVDCNGNEYLLKHDYWSLCNALRRIVAEELKKKKNHYIIWSK